MTEFGNGKPPWPFPKGDGESEGAIRQPGPDLSALESASQVKELIGGAELKPFVSTTVMRPTAALHLLPDALIEAAIDRGQICVADGTECEPVCELELELNGGEPAAVYDAALRLLAVVPLQIEARRTSERKYRLARCIAKEPPIARAPSVDFAADATVEALSRKQVAWERRAGRISAWVCSPTAAIAFRPCSFSTPSGCILRFTPSYCNVEELLAERGLYVSYKTV